jgi:hypothetical protein
MMKRRKKIFLAVLFFSLLLGMVWALFSCSTSMAKTEIESASGQENFTYIPIHREGTIERNQDIIGAKIALWEKDHPEREIVCFQIDYWQAPFLIHSYVNGILLYSQEK